ncbi:hypothetical protein ACFX1Q_045126 [Malus domestica]
MLENGGCRSGLLLSAEGRLQTLLISLFFLLRKKRNKWNRRWIDELFKKPHLYFLLRWALLGQRKKRMREIADLQRPTALYSGSEPPEKNKMVVSDSALLGREREEVSRGT